MRQIGRGPGGRITGLLRPLAPGGSPGHAASGVTSAGFHSSVPIASSTLPEQTSAQSSSLQELRGYVTKGNHVIGKSPEELEEALGYSSGRLKSGFKVYVLVDRLSLGDFVWQGTTESPGGWKHDDASSEQVPCNDLLRADLGKEYDLKHARLEAGQVKYPDLDDKEKAVNTATLKFYEAQAKSLNSKGNPVLKIVPVTTEGTYPPAAVPGVRQWQLVKYKKFKFLGFFPPGTSLFAQPEWFN